MNSGLYAFDGGASATAIAAACANRFSGRGRTRRTCSSGTGARARPARGRPGGVRRARSCSRSSGPAGATSGRRGSRRTSSARSAERLVDVETDLDRSAPTASAAAAWIRSRWLCCKRSRTRIARDGERRARRRGGPGSTSANHMTTVVSGSSARARSRTCAQASCASRSENAIAMRIHRDLSTTVDNHLGEGDRRRAVGAPGSPGGEAGRNIAPRLFHSARPDAGS